MAVIIAGDSWARGEWNWNYKKKYKEISHRGIEQYLLDDNIDVINLGVGGSSNYEVVNRLNLYFERFDSKNISAILIFQTEYTRDFRFFNIDSLYKYHLDNFSSHIHLRDKWIEYFYYQLSVLSQKINVPVWILGGASDTVWFDNMPEYYPGCNILCQSITNLIVNNNHQIIQPVYSWYSNSSVEFIKEVRRKYQDTQELLESINLGFEREYLIMAHPEWFYPDGVHLNRNGHKVLYEFIKKKNISLT